MSRRIAGGSAAVAAALAAGSLCSVPWQASASSAYAVAAAYSVPPASAASWGDNANGQLGRGQTAARTPAPISFPAPPAQATGGITFGIALINNQVWTWGGNTHGELGVAGHATAWTPIQVPLPVPAGVAITSIAAGGNHALVLLSNGAVWGWGANGYGQVGPASPNAIVATPRQIAGLPSNIAVIGASREGSFAIEGGPASSVSRLWVWGDNRNGQLATGSSDTGVHGTPGTVTFPAGVSGPRGADGDGGHMITMMGDGSVYTWGASDYGQLGYAHSGTQYVPLLVSALSGHPARRVFAGGARSLVLMQDGTVWSWGNQAFGGLGDGVSTGSRTAPMRIAALSGVTAMASEGSLSVAISGGEVYGWGNNSSGGTNPASSATSVSVPTAILAGADYVGAGWSTGYAGSAPPVTAGVSPPVPVPTATAPAAGAGSTGTGGAVTPAPAAGGTPQAGAPTGGPGASPSSGHPGDGATPSPTDGSGGSGPGMTELAPEGSTGAVVARQSFQAVESPDLIAGLVTGRRPILGGSILVILLLGLGSLAILTTPVRGWGRRRAEEDSPPRG
jgi:alpha-tubulin suppressor-like RCC1 family protein